MDDSEIEPMFVETSLCIYPDRVECIELTGLKSAFDVTDKLIRCTDFAIASIEEGVTLRTFFEILKQNPMIVEMITPDRFNAILADLQEEGETTEGLVSIVAAWRLERRGQHMNGLFYPEVYGLGSDGDHYGIDLIPLSSFANIQLALPSKHRLVSEENPDAQEFTAHFSLWQFIMGLCFELDWWGTGEKRKEKLESMRQSLEAGLDDIKNGRTYSIEEVFENIKKDCGL